MVKSLLLLYNARSGRKTAGQRLSEVIQILRGAGYRVTVAPITENCGCEEIIPRDGGDFDLVVCCGGDGTLNHLVNAVMNTTYRPVLGYIPTGSTNDFAATLGIPGDVARARKAIASAKPFYFDVGKFGNKYFTYIAAFGAFTQVSYATPQEQKNNLGHAAYIVEALKHLPIGESHAATVTTPTASFSGKYIYGSVSSSTSIGGMHFQMMKDVKLDDGLFEVTLIKAPENIMDLNAIITSVLAQTIGDNPFIQHFKTSKVSFRFEQPVPWTLDGEYGGDTKKVDITVLNKALALLA